jgi:hypothetical protein
MILKIAYIGAEFSFLHLTNACDRQWLYFTPGLYFTPWLVEIVNFNTLKCCFLTIEILSNLSQSSGNGISETLNLKISSRLWPSLTVPQSKRAFHSTAPPELLALKLKFYISLYFQSVV